jgi:hypothetical protein
MLHETIWLGNTLTVWLSALAVALAVYLLLTPLARWEARRPVAQAVKLSATFPIFLDH